MKYTSLCLLLLLIGSFFVVDNAFSFDETQIKKISIGLELTPGDSPDAQEAYTLFIREMLNWFEENHERFEQNGEGGREACKQLCEKGFEEIKKQGFDKFHGNFSFQLLDS